MKCAFKDCKNEHSGSKQFNDIVIRLYLCTEHLIISKDYDSFTQGKEFMKLVEGLA